MLKTVRTMFLLAALVIQSIASGGAFASEQFSSDWLHGVAHAEQTSHHHHTDRSLHLDAEEGPLHHVHVDAGANSFGLPTDTSTWIESGPGLGLTLLNPATWQSPNLEGPLRPPRQLA